MNKFSIEGFEGPLDLLLHLLKQSKMDIHELKIVEITEQYLDYIKNLKDTNLDSSSEYLIMAAELIEMKSRSLLPNNNVENEQGEFVEDPEEELKRRLLEYKKYKESTNTFKELEVKRQNYYTKSPERIETYSEQKLERNDDVSVFDLLEAFKKLLERKNYEKPLNTKITTKELSVKERVVTIRNILGRKRKVLFVDLFDNFDKSYVVVTFLSILEMARNRELVITQENNFADIYLERVD